MKKSFSFWTMSLLLIIPFTGPAASGADLMPKQKPKESAAPSAAPSPELEAVLGQAPELTPKRQDYGAIYVAQNPTAPQPAPQTTVVAMDPMVHAELDRLSAEIQAMKKDIPKKPDTKKAWSSPKVGGRMFIDSVNIMSQNGTANGLHGNLQNAAGFRDVRIGVSGNGYDSFDYKAEMGFAGGNGTVVLVDNWIGAKNLPLLGYVRAGHFKPETGLYFPMSTNDVSLMEYATPASVFGLDRRVGISSENLFAQDRVRAFFGVFQGAATNRDRFLREDNQGTIVNLRLSVAPVFVEEGRRVLHLGGHWEYVGSDSSETATISASPASLGLYAPATLQSGAFACDRHNRGGLEFAYQHGPLSVRSEAFAASYEAHPGFGAYQASPTRNLFGAYVELGWFLTGEHRIYDLKKGSFGAPKVKRNFHPFKCGDFNLVDGLGAWQLVFQWGYTDTSDWRNVSPLAGYQNDLVLGLSWFWTPQLRWVFEYIHSVQSVGPAGAHLHPTEDIFGTSIRVNF